MNVGWGEMPKGPGHKSSWILVEEYMETMSFVTASQESLKNSLKKKGEVKCILQKNCGLQTFKVSWIAPAVGHFALQVYWGKVSWLRFLPIPFIWSEARHTQHEIGTQVCSSPLNG